MKEFLFQKTISYWQFLTICVAVGVVVAKGLSIGALAAMLVTVLIGAIIESVVGLYDRKGDRDE